MKQSRWHVLRDGDVVTLCRHTPPRFDVCAEAVVAFCDPVRLAHQIRQDIWRALQRLRGFSPVVELTKGADVWRVRAGGRVLGRVPGNAQAQLATVLTDQSNQKRWVRHAGPYIGA